MRRIATTLVLSLAVAALSLGVAMRQVNRMAESAIEGNIQLNAALGQLDYRKLNRDVRSDVRALGLRNESALLAVAQCESSLRPDVQIIDTNGKWSRGILQFQDSTWAWMSAEAGVEGSPLNPRHAFRVADWALSNGYGSHWTCYRKLFSRS